jgi:Rieske Fe-S protein
MSIDRRTFLCVAAGAAAAGLAGGCASVALIPVTPANGEIRLPLVSYPQLTEPGGFVRLRSTPDGSAIYVLALAGGSYAALSPICTHRGCTVDVAGSQLLCPCHGSMYDREGRVVRGPAERPLRQFPTTLEAGDELVIRTGGA